MLPTQINSMPNVTVIPVDENGNIAGKDFEMSLADDSAVKDTEDREWLVNKCHVNNLLQ